MFVLREEGGKELRQGKRKQFLYFVDGNLRWEKPKKEGKRKF